jgi:hypothetical protein
MHPSRTLVSGSRTRTPVTLTGAAFTYPCIGEP